MNGRRRYRATIRTWQDVIAADEGTLTDLRGVRDDPLSVWLIVDGERAGLIGRDSIERFGLHAGMTLDTETLARIDDAVCERLCERSAVRSLAARNYCRVGLIRSLRRKGFETGVCERVAEHFVAMGAIDDARVAEITVRNELSRRPAGRRLLEAKLRAKGIDDRDARAAIDAGLEGRDELADARALAVRAVGSMQRGLRSPLGADVIRRRVTGRLARRGFSGDTVRKAVDEALLGDGS